VIEKHFTLSRAEGGVDSAFSLEPAELAALVLESERAWQALGEVRYGPTEAEQKSLVFRRSIYASADIEAGESFTRDNIRIVRPGHGAPPHLFEQLLGRQARQAYSCGNPLSLDKLL
jgi:N-acetylneuraminate synthase